MDRRKALKSITLSTGAVISSGTIFSLLQSCRELDTINWTPSFFSKEEGIALSELVNIIFPASSTPGAVDVGVPQFIDLLMAKSMKEENAEKFRNGLAVFSGQFASEYGDSFAEGKQEDQEAFVKGLYGLSKEDTKAVIKLTKEKEAPSGQEDKYLLYSFLLDTRNLTISSYFSSEKIGEEVLTYDPVPGKAEGCIPVESVGNVYSL